MVDQASHGYGGGPATPGHDARQWQIAERTILERITSMSEPTVPDVRHAFHDELASIDDAFVTAGLYVAEAMPRLVAGFLAGDRTVLAESEALAVATANTCELVDEAGFVLLARQAPVSGDLRRLVALLRMTVDVHRSASLLRHACHTLKTFDPRFLAEPLRSQLEEMAVRSSDVFAAGMDAWRRRDALAVTEVDRLDEAVDELQKGLLRETQLGGEDIGEGMLVLGLLTRYFERIADHGVEIARDAAFVATGERVRVGSRAKEAAAQEAAAQEAAAQEAAGGEVEADQQSATDSPGSAGAAASPGEPAGRGPRDGDAGPNEGATGHERDQGLAPESQPHDDGGEGRP